MIYFDHNATSPLDPAVFEIWQRALHDFPGNPSSLHRLGQRADRALEMARSEIADLLAAPVGEVLFTSGATESNNMALQHLAQSQQGEAWISAIEHPSVLEPAQHYFRERLRLIPVTQSGGADMNWISSKLRRSQPACIAVMAANNETGVIQPWREIAILCREHSIPFFCDATQWLGRLPSVGFHECTYLSASAHKCGGPRGVGLLRCPLGTIPLLRGGGQEDGRRAGTENVPAVVAAAAAWVRGDVTSRTQGAEKLGMRQAFEKRLMATLREVQILGMGEDRLWNTVAALMPPGTCRARWLVKLDKLGYAVSTGSACASGTEKPSHVMAAMDIPDEAADRMLRFSSGWHTTEAEWNALLGAIEKAHRELAEPQSLTKPM